MTREELLELFPFVMSELGFSHDFIESMKKAARFDPLKCGKPEHAPQRPATSKPCFPDHPKSSLAMAHFDDDDGPPELTQDSLSASTLADVL